MEIRYSKQAVKSINAMDVVTKQRIKAAIENLPAGDIKLLKGKCVSTYRLRVGAWRVLFSYGDNIIEIEKIAPRGQAYKGV